MELIVLEAILALGGIISIVLMKLKMKQLFANSAERICLKLNKFPYGSF